MAEKVNYLNPALRGKFRITGTHLPRVLNSPVGDIHFGELTEEQAVKLCDCGFDYLERIPSEKSVSKKEAQHGSQASEAEAQQEQGQVTD